MDALVWDTNGTVSVQMEFKDARNVKITTSYPELRLDEVTSEYKLTGRTVSEHAGGPRRGTEVPEGCVPRWRWMWRGCCRSVDPGRSMRRGAAAAPLALTRHPPQRLPAPPLCRS